MIFHKYQKIMYIELDELVERVKKDLHLTFFNPKWSIDVEFN